jgi:hypothetical protein
MNFEYLELIAVFVLVAVGCAIAGFIGGLV